jgi:hypothetical protein
MPACCTGCPVAVGAGGVAVGIGWPYRSELCRWFGIGTTDNDEELLQEAVELANGADRIAGRRRVGGIGGAGRRALDRRVISVSSRRSTADADKSDGTPGIILQ